jgi:uncharacterized repeat protein (TIGR01451 family)
MKKIITCFLLFFTILSADAQEFMFYPYNYPSIAYNGSFGIFNPTEILVTNSNDAGPGSLREAIIQANNIPSTKIGFRFSGGTISINSPLPTVTGLCIIDGFTYIDINGNPIGGQFQQSIRISAATTLARKSIPIKYMGSSTIRHCLINFFDNFSGIELTVTNIASGGPGSYVNAVREANTIYNTIDTIRFNIPGQPPHKLSLYPDEIPFTYEFNGGVVIDGLSQPLNGATYSGPPIELSNYGPLSIRASNVRISGLHINSAFQGIVIGKDYTTLSNISIEDCVINRCTTAVSLNYNGSYSSYIENITIQNNIIGLMPDGVTIAANGNGILAGGKNINIINNVISGNTWSGITNINASSYVVFKLRIKGNKIGTDISGTIAKPNKYGINLDMADTVWIGGDLPADGNIISGNTLDGIHIDVSSNSFNTRHYIKNNIIGADVTGLVALPNQAGIFNYGPNYSYHIEKNTIAFNSTYAIRNYFKSFIKDNSIFENQKSFYSSDLPYYFITIKSRTNTKITGQTRPNYLVQLFYDDAPNGSSQGKTFIGETTSDGNGDFEYNGAITSPCEVVAIGTHGTNFESTFFSSFNFSLGQDKLVCNGDVVTLDAGFGGSYLWSTGETSQTISVSSAGAYSVEVQNGCITKDTINVSYTGPPTVNLGNDTTICGGTTLLLNSGYSNATYLWNGGSTSQYKNVSSGKHYVKVNIGSCESSDTINVASLPSIFVNLGADQTVCSGTNVNLNAGNAGASFLWSSGKTTQVDTITSPGKHWVRVFNQHCFKSDTININHVNFSVNLGKDTALCAGQSVILDAGNPGSVYKWNNVFANNTQTRNITSGGTYFVEVRQGTCIKYDTIAVAFSPAINVNLGGDAILCDGTVKVLDGANTGVTYLWSTGAISQTLSVDTSGTYAVKVSRSAYCFASDTVSIIFADCNQVSGSVFTDANSNGIKETGESGNSGVLIILKNTDSGITYYATSDAAGNYSANVPLGNYETKSNQTVNHSVVFPANNLYTFNLDGNTALINKNFGLALNPTSDLAISIVSVNNFRLGETGTYKIVYENKSFTSVSCVVKCLADPYLTYLSSTPDKSGASGDSILWVTNLGPTERKEIIVKFSIPLNLSLAQKACLTKCFISSAQDANMLNNNAEWKLLFAYPYDPNNKIVTPSGTTSAGYISANDSVLTYTINFQNTGNDTARTVVIRDTLSSNLDIPTFSVITSSHGMNANISGTGIVTFTFNNIMLPDSNVNEAESHGFVQYSINLKPALTDGTVIRNTAYIYFDAALPVKTNSATNTISSSLLFQSISFPPVTDFSYDEQGFRINANASSGLNLEYAVSGPAYLLGDSLVFTGVGPLRLRVIQDGNSLYNSAGYSDQLFNINKATQKITLDSIPEKTFGDGAFTLNINGGNSGNPVIINIVSGPAIMNGNQIVITGPGVVMLQISQDGNINYEAADVVYASFLVNQSTNISKKLQGFMVGLHPNPCSEQIQITLPDFQKGETVFVELLSLQGTTINSFYVNDNIFEYLTDHFPKGIYYLKFTMNEKVTLRKIIIQ